MTTLLYIDAGQRLEDSYTYRYYGDLYRELTKLAQIYLYEGKVSNIQELLQHIPETVDCIIFGLGFFAQSHASHFEKIKGLAELEIPVVCLLHKAQKLLKEKLEFCRLNKINLLVDPCITYKEYGEELQIPSMRAWFTADPALFYPREEPRIYDIGFSGASHGAQKIEGETQDLREKVYERLKATEYNLFWNMQNIPDDRLPLDEYILKMSQSKIWFATTGPLLDVSPRYFEVMMSKTLLLCNAMPTQYEGVFEDGVNCVTFKNDLSDLEEKIEFYLKNEADRDIIVENAYHMATTKYTWKHMAEELLKKIRDIKRGE